MHVFSGLPACRNGLTSTKRGSGSRIFLNGVWSDGAYIHSGNDFIKADNVKISSEKQDIKCSIIRKTRRGELCSPPGGHRHDGLSIVSYCKYTVGQNAAEEN